MKLQQVPTAFWQSVSPQRAQRLLKILFLSVLSDLCGERLCFFFDQTGCFLAGGRAYMKLFISHRALRSHIQKNGLSGMGKAMAYNEFIHWYSDLKGSKAEAADLDAFKRLRNQLILWGNNHVVNQTSLLLESLQKDEDNLEQVMTRAEQVFAEIKRELGYRSHRRDRYII